MLSLDIIHKIFVLVNNNTNSVSSLTTGSGPDYQHFPKFKELIAGSKIDVMDKSQKIMDNQSKMTKITEVG